MRTICFHDYRPTVVGRHEVLRCVHCLLIKDDSPGDLQRAKNLEKLSRILIVLAVGCSGVDAPVPTNRSLLGIHYRAECDRLERCDALGDWPSADACAEGMTERWCDSPLIDCDRETTEEEQARVETCARDYYLAPCEAQLRICW